MIRLSYIYNMQKQQEKDNKKIKEIKKQDKTRKEETEIVGPSSRKLRKVEYHDLLLEGLPTSDLYQLSYMHKETINNVISSSKSDFIITFSIDGHIKFWKKVFNLVQFTKNFKAHNGLITGAALSKNHDLLCTIGLDKTLKIFDLLNSDLRSAIKLNFVPSCCQFVPQTGCDWQLVAVSEQKTGKILFIDHEMKQSNKDFDDGQELIVIKTNQQDEQKNQNQKQDLSYIVNTVSFHKHPIKAIKMNWNLNICISIDERAFVQIWDPITLDFPKHLSYKCKIQTDFLQLLSVGSSPISLNISPKGTYAAILMKDKIIRVFNLKTGKLIEVINQDIKTIAKIQQDISHPNYSMLVFDQNEYQKKLSLEKQTQMARDFLFNSNVQFDETQQFLIYASFHGIKMYSFTNKCIERIIGKKESERFVKVSLFQGKMMRNPNGNANVYGQRKSTDPLIICTSYRRSRFYMFSRRIPNLQGENAIIRDVINERNTKQQSLTISQPKITEKQNQVVLQTTMGDIHLLLYLEDCPKTCENFIKLIKKNYYNGMIFHRVIKGFMNQTGCPKGDGTGGQSIWGGNFEDELRPQKYRFDKPYVLAMANRGPNTNGSQFFITVIACPWLDNKHTIFGRVIKGIQAVCEINKLKTDKGQKPLNNVKIMSAKLM